MTKVVFWISTISWSQEQHFSLYNKSSNIWWKLSVCSCIFVVTLFFICKYLKYPVQGAIAKYVWSYRILIFLIFWFFVTIFFILQIFDKFSATNNRACTPICVKLSDIDIFDLLIFLYVFFPFCNYLKYPVQSSIVNACQYVWSYRILIFWEARPWHFNSWIGLPIHIWVTSMRAL